MGTDCFDSQLNKRKFTGFAEKRSGHIV